MSHRNAAVALVVTVSGILAWFAWTSPQVAPPRATPPTPSTETTDATVASPAPAAPVHPLADAATPAAAAPVAPPAPRPGGVSAAVAEASPSRADAAVRSPGALRGALVDAGGRPLADVPVVAVAADGSDAAEDVTDEEGRFLLLALRPGHYAVFAGLGSPLASRVGALGATVEPAGLTEIALRARASGATVRVHAVDLAGREARAQAVLVRTAGREPAGLGAVLASEVILLPGATRTIVEAVPPGRWTVVLLAGDEEVRAPAQIEVEEADLDVEVRLAEPVSVL